MKIVYNILSYKDTEDPGMTKEKLQELGSQGWELCAITYSIERWPSPFSDHGELIQQNGRHFIFKRREK